jgi:hypothetical protein
MCIGSSLMSATRKKLQLLGFLSLLEKIIVVPLYLQTGRADLSTSTNRVSSRINSPWADAFDQLVYLIISHV